MVVPVHISVSRSQSDSKARCERFRPFATVFPIPGGTGKPDANGRTRSYQRFLSSWGGEIQMRMTETVHVRVFCPPTGQQSRMRTVALVHSRVFRVRGAKGAGRGWPESFVSALSVQLGRGNPDANDRDRSRPCFPFPIGQQSRMRTIPSVRNRVSYPPTGQQSRIRTAANS